VPLNLQPAAYTMEIFKDFFKDVDGPTASCLIAKLAAPTYFSVKFSRVCAMVTLHTGGCNPTDIATYARQVELFADLLNDMVCAEPVDMLEGDIIATVKALGPPFTSPISSRRRDGRRLSELLDRVVEVRGSLVALAGASASSSSGAAAARTVAPIVHGNTTLGPGYSLGLPHDLREASDVVAHMAAGPLESPVVEQGAAPLQHEQPAEIATSYMDLHGRLTSTELALRKQGDMLSVIVTKFLDLESDNSRAEVAEEESLFMQRAVKGLNTALVEAQRREDLSKSSVASEKAQREEDAYRQQHINATFHESIANIRAQLSAASTDKVVMEAVSTPRTALSPRSLAPPRRLLALTRLNSLPS
jgi:hypothetical protein